MLQVRKFLLILPQKVHNYLLKLAHKHKPMLKRTYDRNDSKRPAISQPKQILDVTSRLFWAYYANNIYAYLCTKK